MVVKIISMINVDIRQFKMEMVQSNKLFDIGKDKKIYIWRWKYDLNNIGYFFII